MGKIILDKITLFGFHGHLEKERTMGSLFSIRIEIELDLLNASINDELSKTIDYRKLYEIVKIEMKKKSRLIENLAKRIMDKIKKIKKLKHIKITICKENPPLNCLNKVCITLEE